MARFTRSPLALLTTALFAAVTVFAALGAPARAGDMKPGDAPAAPPVAPPAAPPAAPAMDDPAMADPAMGDPAMADPAANGGAAAPAAPTIAGVANPFWDPKAPVTLADGAKELVTLKDLLKKSKSDNRDILASLESLAKAYANVVPNDEAGKATFEADKEKFQKEAEKLFLDALEVTRVKPNTRANDRDDVNVRAAQVLAWARKDTTKGIIDILETRVFKAKDYDPPTTLYDEAFKAIAFQNDLKVGLPYCMEWMKYSSNKGDAERTKAAYEALVLFRDVKAPLRHEIVKKTLITFIGVESSSDRGRTKEEQTMKANWEKSKTAVIKAMQVYCKEPKAKDGALIAKISAFQQWFNDNEKGPAFVDPKIVK